MNDTKIQSLVSGAIAVMFGFVVYKIIKVQFLGNGGNNGMPDPTFSASGDQCGALGAPDGYVEGSMGCNYLTNCENNGGTGTATPDGSGGWQLGCIQSSFGASPSQGVSPSGMKTGRKTGGSSRTSMRSFF